MCRLAVIRVERKAADKAEKKAKKAAARVSGNKLVQQAVTRLALACGRSNGRAPRPR